MLRRKLGIALLLSVVGATLLAQAGLGTQPQQKPKEKKDQDKKQAPSRRAAQRNGQQTALEPFQSFVGDWRGVGQLRRGSARGSWREQGQWAWKFPETGALLRLDIQDGKYLSLATLQPLGDKRFRLTATPAQDGKPIRYEGLLDKPAQIVLTATTLPTEKTVPARITLRTTAAGKRLVILLERQLGTGDRYSRLAEVGYTRKGSGFGKGTSFVECVVTGGKGTIAVSYAGKTYYVCCGGCRDLFNEDPAAILAEYAAKKQAAKKQAAEKKAAK